MLRLSGLHSHLRAMLIGIVCLSLSGLPQAASAIVPDDPDFNEQWYLESAGFTEAWEIAKGSPTVTVAVLDSGVDISHPDLRNRIWQNPGDVPGDGIDNDGNGYVDDAQGWDFVDDDNDPNPVLLANGFNESEHHGTLVSGVIGAAGNNGEGVTGVNWNVRIMPLRVLDSRGFGSTQDVVAAVRYAADNGAKVLNISFTGGNYSPSLAEAMQYAHAKGVTIVAAAGNEGDTAQGGNLNDYPAYPVCYRGGQNEPIVIGVASVDRNDVLSSFSSYGSDCITVSAPGESYYTTQVFRPFLQGYDKAYGDSWFGSSMSAPLVAGLAALIYSMIPDATPAVVKRYLTENAVPVDHFNFLRIGQIGAGRIDAEATIKAVLNDTLLGTVPESGISENEGVLLPGTLIKTASNPAVYYLGNDRKRYVFPHEKVFRTWYGGFPTITILSPEELAAIPLGGNVTHRPGARMVKIQSDPRVYAVAKGGVLRHVETENVARNLYGPDWALSIDDVSEAFFVDYRLGSPIQTAADYSPSDELGRTLTINHDKGL